MEVIVYATCGLATLICAAVNFSNANMLPTGLLRSSALALGWACLAVSITSVSLLALVLAL